MKRIYLAGPMTGLPEFNYPAFHDEAARLRALGFEVVNPAENPEQPCWAEYMKQDIPLLLGCDTIALLPGWHESTGARLEHHIAKHLGIFAINAADIRRHLTASANVSMKPSAHQVRIEQQLASAEVWETQT